MNRKSFLKALALMPVAGATMKMKALENLTDSFNSTDLYPVLFVGHGSPMNAIEENEFSRKWKELGNTLPKPNAILCISAHWETRGTFVTAMENPQTIHDFGGFPQALFDVEYPAPGSPELASLVRAEMNTTSIGADLQWGLDHGCWSVVKNIYPEANIPIVQMSLDYSQPPFYHYELAKKLDFLRSRGVLIIGSGNMVHNLRLVAWNKMKEPEYGYDWALEAREKMNRYIMEGNHGALIRYKEQGKAFDLAIPTPDHFLPLLYALALQRKNEQVTFFNDKPVMGSLTMTSVMIS